MCRGLWDLLVQGSREQSDWDGGSGQLERSGSSAHGPAQVPGRLGPLSATCLSTLNWPAAFPCHPRGPQGALRWGGGVFLVSFPPAPGNLPVPSVLDSHCPLGAGGASEQAVSAPAAPPSAHSLPSSRSPALGRCPWSWLIRKELLRAEGAEWVRTSAGLHAPHCRGTWALGREAGDGSGARSQEPQLESQGGTLRGPGSTCGSASWDLEVTEGMSRVAEPRLSQAPFPPGGKDAVPCRAVGGRAAAAPGQKAPLWPLPRPIHQTPSAEMADPQVRGL